MKTIILNLVGLSGVGGMVSSRRKIVIIVGLCVLLYSPLLVGVLYPRDVQVSYEEEWVGFEGVEEWVMDFVLYNGSTIGFGFDGLDHRLSSLKERCNESKVELAHSKYHSVGYFRGVLEWKNFTLNEVMSTFLSFQETGYSYNWSGDVSSRVSYMDRDVDYGWETFEDLVLAPEWVGSEMWFFKYNLADYYRKEFLFRLPLNNPHPHHLEDFYLWCFSDNGTFVFGVRSGAGWIV